METFVKPEELFEGAFIRQCDQENATAVITKLHDELVDVVAIDTWVNNRNQPVDSIEPAYLTGGFPLRRMGFLRDLSSVNPQYNLTIPTGILTVFQREESWVLTDGNQSASVHYAHQVQAETKRLFNFTIVVTPLGVNDQQEEDYYLE